MESAAVRDYLMHQDILSRRVLMLKVRIDGRTPKTSFRKTLFISATMVRDSKTLARTVLDYCQYRIGHLGTADGRFWVYFDHQNHYAPKFHNNLQGHVDCRNVRESYWVKRLAFSYLDLQRGAEGPASVVRLGSVVIHEDAVEAAVAEDGAAEFSDVGGAF